ncbi:MAG: hypothetical protein LBN95_10395 [Prevotellaceae bacterium]|jgi:hypothetical protein|nr:hypothetical protein [Prevotellaceae bacterium]
MTNTAFTGDDVIVGSHILQTGFQPPKFVNGVPEGYMTGDEFVKRVKHRITNFYRANGLSIIKII